MSTYYELNQDLEQLLNDLDAENNDNTRSDIEYQIAKLRQEIAHYDLSNDDLFRCVQCDAVDDIENATQTACGLICECCVS